MKIAPVIDAIENASREGKNISYLEGFLNCYLPGKNLLIRLLKIQRQ